MDEDVPLTLDTYLLPMQGMMREEADRRIKEAQKKASK